MDTEVAAGEILGQLTGPWRAVMVYGSRVRGDFTEESDLDVLQLVDEGGPHYSRGLMVVTVRPVHELQRQSRHGDLYVLSLIREGRILADPSGVLAETLALYRPPADNYAGKWREYQLKLSLLDLPPDVFAANRVPFVRAALYLLRNSCYIAHLRSFGEPCFSLAELSASLRIPRLQALFQGRADPDNLTRERFDEVRTTLGRLFAVTELG